MERLNKRRHDAIYRRQALVHFGCSTYVMAWGHASIICLCCGMLSSSPNDIELKYCGFCSQFHSEQVKKADERT